MDRDTAVARIKRGLAFRSDLDNEIVDALKEAQRKREVGLTPPWFLLKEDQPLSIVSLNPNVTIPVDFWRTGEGEKIKLTVPGETKPTFIPRYDLDKAIALFGDVGNGVPGKAYVLRTSTLRFFPTPDTSYTATWSYYQHDQILSTNIENLWLKYAPDLLIGDAGSIIAADLRDKDAVSIFNALQTTGLREAFQETIQRELDDFPLHMGEQL